MRKLSGGLRRRLSVALALVGAPRLVVLDEPSAGAAPPLEPFVVSAPAFLGGNGSKECLQPRRASLRAAAPPRGRTASRQGAAAAAATGMDAAARRLLWGALARAKRGRVIVLCTHSMEEADAVADRCPPLPTVAPTHVPTVHSLPL